MVDLPTRLVVACGHWTGIGNILWFVIILFLDNCDPYDCAVLTLRAFLRRRAQFSEFAKSNSSLTMARYFRLMALASLELVCTTPIALFGMAMAIQGGVQPYRGWANVHWYYSRVGQYPAILWRSNKQAVIFLALPRYLYIVCAVMFFLFFGFSDEARRYYKEVIGLVMKVLRISPPADNSTIATFGYAFPFLFILFGTKRLLQYTYISEADIQACSGHLSTGKINAAIKFLQLFAHISTHIGQRKIASKDGLVHDPPHVGVHPFVIPNEVFF